jgi:hypothetical protein
MPLALRSAPGLAPAAPPAAANADPLEARIAAMRLFLDHRSPESGAEALKALREAFPELPLAERLLACASRR